MHRRVLFSLQVSIGCLILVLTSPLLAQVTEGAQNPLSVRPQDRIATTIDDEQRVVLRGNLHPLARAENQVGAAPPDYRMEGMVIAFKLDATQQSGLDALVAAQQRSAISLLSPVAHSQKLRATLRHFAE